MRLLLLTSSLLALTAAVPTVIQDRTQLLNFYDYVVVGGGTAGLVLGNRLSEDPKVTVLVLEAGPLMPKNDFDAFSIPLNILFTTSAASPLAMAYDWNITSRPLLHLANRTVPVTSRRVVGGGSATNAVFFPRGSRRDYDDWAEYLGDPSWGWEGLLPYFKKMEIFHPPGRVMQELGAGWEAGVHGARRKRSGIHAAFPEFAWADIPYWRDAQRALGIPMPKDGVRGDTGLLWVPNSVNPANYTRSFARTGYHDPAAVRRNYHLMTGQTVTQILFDKHKRATGVKYAASASAPVRKVKAAKEVILSAGAIHSPRLLQLSGIGDARLLKKLKIPQIVDLPGVGQNFQDHPYFAMSFSYAVKPTFADIASNQTYREEALKEYHEKATGPFTQSIGNLAGFLALEWISPRFKSLLSAAAATDDKKHLRKDIHPSVLKGYKRQKTMVIKSLGTTKAAAFENVQAFCVLQRPLSRGYVEISSRNPFDAPGVDYRALSHDFDLRVLIDGLRFMRKIVSHPEFKGVGTEKSPGEGVRTEEDMERWMREVLQPTFWHPGCTCHAGRREDGGVVGADFGVHGVKGLRVVDASVFPMMPGTHLSSTVYAVAEKAADQIKRDWKGEH